MTQKTDESKIISDLKSNPDHTGSFSSVNEDTRGNGTHSKSLTVTQKTYKFDTPDNIDVVDYNDSDIPNSLK